MAGTAILSNNIEHMAREMTSERRTSGSQKIIAAVNRNEKLLYIKHHTPLKSISLFFRHHDSHLNIRGSPVYTIMFFKTTLR